MRSSEVGAPSGSPSGGWALVEVMVALTLGAVVVAWLGGTVRTTLREVRGLAVRSDNLEVVRTVWTVLDEEVGVGRPGEDWWLGSREVLSLRAFRGIASVCGASESEGAWRIAYRGRREPVPARDSVLVLGADGGWRPFALDRVQPGVGCDGFEGSAGQVWSWDQAGAPPPVLARLFERGSYHLNDGAFRYRRGEGGRQPLTPERLGEGSGFRLLDGRVEVRLSFIDSSGSAGAEDSTDSAPPFIWILSELSRGT